MKYKIVVRCALGTSQNGQFYNDLLINGGDCEHDLFSVICGFIVCLVSLFYHFNSIPYRNRPSCFYYIKLISMRVVCMF